MLTTACPKCEQEVTVPPTAGPESKVRCPLCSEEYSLDIVFAEMPPLLELLDVPSSNGAASHAAAKDDAMDLAEADVSEDDDGDIALSEAEPEKGPTASAFNFGDEPAAADAGAATTTGKAVRPGRKRKQANPILQLLPVVLGGMMALPIAQMILWWLPGDWKRDPVGLAPNLPSFMAFLAPESLRKPGLSEEPDDADNTAQTPRSGNGRPPKDALSNLTSNGTGDNSFGRDLSGALLGNEQDNDKSDRPKNNPRNPRRNGGNNSQDGNQNGNGNNQSGGGDPINEVASPVIGPKNAPTYEAAELGAALTDAKNVPQSLAMAADTTLEAADRFENADRYQAEIGKLAHVATHTDPRPDGYEEDLDGILSQVSDSTSKLRVAANLAVRHLKQEARESDGILISGTVEKIQKHGPQLHEAVIKLKSTSQQPISVFGKKNPKGAFNVGDTVIILGTIIDDPQADLGGYRGPSEPVIWGGYSYSVPLPE